MVAWARYLCWLAPLWLAGCAANHSGSNRDFRVRGGQYFTEPLPGDEPAEADAGATQGPAITSLQASSLSVFAGQGDVGFSGRTSKDGVAVGIALEGVSGHWIVPVGSIDPTTEEPTWSVTADLEVSLKQGNHELRVVAIDDEGHAGRQLSLTLCVTGKVPDNRNACDPDRAPPRAVISLQWDVDADLDLQVVAPDGRVFEATHPKSSAPDAGTEMGDNVGADPSFDRDSTAGCVRDGLRTENLVWNEEEPQGKYRIYVTLFDACKQPAVRFSVGIYTAEPSGKDETAPDKLRKRATKYGELLDIDADPAAGRGLFVTEYRFN